MNPCNLGSRLIPACLFPKEPFSKHDPKLFFEICLILLVFFPAFLTLMYAGKGMGCWANLLGEMSWCGWEKEEGEIFSFILSLFFSPFLLVFALFRPEAAPLCWIMV